MSLNLGLDPHPARPSRAVEIRREQLARHRRRGWQAGLEPLCDEVGIGPDVGEDTDLRMG